LPARRWLGKLADMNDHRAAQCLCGSLRVEVEGEPVVVGVCHCLECQRRSGSPFGAGAFFEASRVHVSGAERQYTRSVPAGRTVTNHFCPECGSNVYWEVQAWPGMFGVAVGAFADPQFPPPGRSVFERSAHPWVAFAIEVPHRDRADGERV
jgi:hypothetical protein